MRRSVEADHRRAVGSAIRDLGHAVVGNDIDEATLDELRQTLRALVERIDDGPARSRAHAEFTDHVPEPHHDTGAVESYDDRPFSGQASPWGVDLSVHRRGQGVEAVVTLRAAHEGAPGRAHGGIVAGLFDDVFGFVLGVLGEPAFTGELTIRYQAPTPLHRPLRCAGRLVGRDGRKLYIDGELIDATTPGEPVVARAEGLFITVNPQVFAETMQLPAPPPDD
jgi:acyl-coenzyme A thioesterase PaaI-like protein